MQAKYWQIVTAHPLPKDLERNQPELSDRALSYLIMLIVLAVNVDDICTHH